MKTLLAITAGLIIGAAIGVAVHEARGDNWSRTYASFQQPVEQQTCDGGYNEPDCPPSLWVTNPTSCPWDVDDRLEASASARIGPGESIGGDECLIADAWHGIYVTGCVRSGRLEFRATTPTGDWVLSRTVSQDCAAMCIFGSAYPIASPYMQDIPGSNGGRGVPTTLSVRLTNTSKGKRQASVLLSLEHQAVTTERCGHWWEGQAAGFTCDEPVDGPRFCWRMP